jgi:hypothetical protein
MALWHAAQVMEAAEIVIEKDQDERRSFGSKEGQK